MDRDTSFACDIDTYFWTQQPSNNFITLKYSYEHSQNPKTYKNINFDDNMMLMYIMLQFRFFQDLRITDSLNLDSWEQNKKKKVLDGEKLRADESTVNLNIKRNKQCRWVHILK